MENKELETKRHSCAHIMAQAVQQLLLMNKERKNEKKW